MSRVREWTDYDMLTALHMRDHHRMTRQQIAVRLGRTKEAITGLFDRIERDTNAVDVSPHLNGTMPVRWWAKGRRRSA
jgi:hypothetical protein